MLMLRIAVTYLDGRQAEEGNRLFSIFRQESCQVFASEGPLEGGSGFLVSPLED